MERDGQGSKGPVQKARLPVKGGDGGKRSEDDEDAEERDQIKLKYHFYIKIKNKLGCYSVQLCLAGVGVGQVFVKKLFTCVMLWLYTEFQCSTMPGTGEKVCGVVVVVGGVVT